jgi:hypothetical protein
MGGRKWAHEVNMNVGKFLWWDGDMLWNSVSVAVKICSTDRWDIGGSSGQAVWPYHAKGSGRK